MVNASKHECGQRSIFFFGLPYYERSRNPRLALGEAVEGMCSTWTRASYLILPVQCEALPFPLDLILLPLTSRLLLWLISCGFFFQILRTHC